MSQDLHLKASGFLAEGSSFLANMYCTVRKSTAKSQGKLSKNEQKSRKQKTELRTYVCPTVYSLV